LFLASNESLRTGRKYITHGVILEPNFYKIGVLCFCGTWKGVLKYTFILLFLVSYNVDQMYVNKFLRVHKLLPMLFWTRLVFSSQTLANVVLDPTGFHYMNNNS